MKVFQIFSVVLVLFLSFGKVALSQNSPIDSLKIELMEHSANDTTRVHLLNALAFSYFTSDVALSVEYLEEAKTIAEVIHFEKGKARSVYIKGITEAIQSNYNQSLRYYDEALKLYENIGFTKGVANCYNAIGIAYKNKGELKTATTYLKKAIDIDEKIGSSNLSASLLNLGTAYSDLGDFDEAIIYLKTALSIAESEKNEQRVAYSLNNLGTIYNLQGNSPLALEHYNKSLSIHEKLGDSISIAHNFSNMASLYKLQKNSEKAISYYEKSLGIYERINNRHQVAATLNGIGGIYEEKGDYKKALHCYLKALRIGKELGANSETAYILNNIGGIYFVNGDYEKSEQHFKEAKNVSLENGSKETLCGAYLGLARINIHQRDYGIALGNVLKAKRISEESGFLESQKQAFEMLSEIYAKTGDYNNAFKSHQQFKILNDSLFNKKNIEKIAQLEFEYKYQQALDSASIRELELTKAVTDTNKNLAKTQRDYLWAIISVLLVSILLGSSIFYEKLKNEKAKTQNAVIEQKLLRSQMTPHFIFNSLSVLQGMILNKEKTKSIRYLSKFSKLLRITLENSREKMVLLSQELTAIKDYSALQNLESDNYKCNVLVEGIIDVSLFKVPPMLIQPFVENAIEHAFIKQQDNRKIEVKLDYVDKKLICTITDNGIGINSMPKGKNKNKNSLATTITSERLKILSKDFKMKGSVTIEDRQKYNEPGTMVTLIIPHVLLKV
ncbi:tetratricopeptide repeat protein [Tamlana crocina]